MNEYEIELKDVVIADLKYAIGKTPLQTREALTTETVSNYVDNIDNILSKSPIDVCQLDGENYLVNGYHRLEAYRQAYPDATTIKANVRPVEMAAAIEVQAWSSNFDHGERLTPSEERESIKQLSKMLDYSGIDEDEYLKEMEGWTTIGRRKLRRHTQDELETIKGRFWRAVCLKHEEGGTTRSIPSDLEISRAKVTTALEKMAEGEFPPFPNDLLTRLSVHNLLLQVKYFDDDEKPVSYWHKSYIENESWCYVFKDFPESTVAVLEGLYKDYTVPTPEGFREAFPERALTGKEADMYRYMRRNCLIEIETILSDEASLKRDVEGFLSKGWDAACIAEKLDISVSKVTSIEESGQRGKIPQEEPFFTKEELDTTQPSNPADLTPPVSRKAAVKKAFEEQNETLSSEVVEKTPDEHAAGALHLFAEAWRTYGPEVFELLSNESDMTRGANIQTLLEAAEFLKS